MPIARAHLAESMQAFVYMCLFLGCGRCSRSRPACARRKTAAPATVATKFLLRHQHRLWLLRVPMNWHHQQNQALKAARKAGMNPA
jgi:hypothetical protein